MIKQNKEDCKGITLVTLTIAIIIMLIITSTLIYQTNTGNNVRKLNNMYEDITNIKEKVDLYYAKYHEIPIVETPYENVSNIRSINPNDNDVYYVVDLEAMGNITLNYGKSYHQYIHSASNELTDIYVINERSHSIYYIKGIEFEGDIYYTIPTENTRNYTS